MRLHYGNARGGGKEEEGLAISRKEKEEKEDEEKTIAIAPPFPFVPRKSLSIEPQKKERKKKRKCINRLLFVSRKVLFFFFDALIPLKKCLLKGDRRAFGVEAS